MSGHYYSNYADVLGLVLPGDEQDRFDPPSDIRGFPMKEITCMVRGKVEINPNHVRELKTTQPTTDGLVTTVIWMWSGESYYVRGKNHFQVADDLGITLEASKHGSRV